MGDRQLRPVPRSVPQILELPERKLCGEVDQVVFDVDDQAAVLTSVLGTAQSATHHLLVEVRRVSRPRDDHCANRRSVESLRKHTIVCERSYPTRAEFLDDVASYLRGRLAGDRS